VPIDREGGKGRDQLGRPASMVREGRSVMMYPEGTRAPGHALLPFRRGAAVLAIRAGVPILPVVVSGSGALMPPWSVLVRPGRVRVEVLAPIPTSSMTFGDAAQLIDTVRQSLARRYRTEADGPPCEQQPEWVAALMSSSNARVSRTRAIGGTDSPKSQT
jgi:1-acyl-sn-glycerol-3-phosphate acyltransferase